MDACLPLAPSPSHFMPDRQFLFFPLSRILIQPITPHETEPSPDLPHGVLSRERERRYGVNLVNSLTAFITKSIKLYDVPFIAAMRVNYRGRKPVLLYPCRIRWQVHPVIFVLLSNTEYFISLDGGSWKCCAMGSDVKE